MKNRKIITKVGSVGGGGVVVVGGGGCGGGGSEDVVFMQTPKSYLDLCLLSHTRLDLYTPKPYQAGFIYP